MFVPLPERFVNKMIYTLLNSVSGSEQPLASSVLSDTDAVSATDAISAFGFKFEPDNFLQALPTIGICMLAIFCVMLLIIIVTALISKLGAVKPDSDSKK